MWTNDNCFLRWMNSHAFRTKFNRPQFSDSFPVFLRVPPGGHAIRRIRLIFLIALFLGWLGAAIAAENPAVEITATWPGEKGPTIKVEAYPILSRVIDEETERVTARLGKRQTFDYLRPGMKKLVMPFEAGDWRLKIKPENTDDVREYDVTLESGSVEKIGLALGKIIAAPRTVGDEEMPAKVEVYRSEQRIFYGYTKNERRNVVVCLFPGTLRVRINGDEESKNFLESRIKLSAGTLQRVTARFGQVLVVSAIPKAKYEFFQRKSGSRKRVLFLFTKPEKRTFKVHLRPGSYEVDVTNEDTERKTTRLIEVTESQSVSLD